MNDKRVRVRSVNHGFSCNQQDEYDSLSARGRDAYDALRWYEDETHERAFRKALNEHGLKKSI